MPPANIVKHFLILPEFTNVFQFNNIKKEKRNK